MKVSPIAILAIVLSLVAGVVAYFGSIWAVPLCVLTALTIGLSIWASGDAPVGTEAESYVVLEKLGEGGMGEVFVARQGRLRRLVALKRIKALQQNSEQVARFKREARALSQLSSPHTISVFDAGVEADGSYFYVMELLDGRNLAQLVDDHGQQSAARVIHILRQSCLSLIEAHQHGLVHRDLKPENIMLCRYGAQFDFVKVLDFGLVKIAEEDPETSGPITRAGALPGTPAFLAPEAVLGSSFIDARTDLYALGAIAFYVLTGRLVFEGDSPLEVVQAHRQMPPPRASDFAREVVPRELEDLIQRCLKKLPEERPQSALALFIELEKMGAQYPWHRADAERCWEPAAEAEAPQ